MVGRIWRFIKYNKFKRISVLCWIYSACFRLQILYVDMKKLQKKWGIEGEESPITETEETYRYASGVGFCVSHVCTRTKWESKCLVRALTAQKLLLRRKIDSTLYLGCGLQEGKMVAHAWLRCGEMFVTGGNGEGYAVVDRFRALSQ